MLRNSYLLLINHTTQFFVLHQFSIRAWFR